MILAKRGRPTLQLHWFLRVLLILIVCANLFTVVPESLRISKFTFPSLHSKSLFLLKLFFAKTFTVVLKSLRISKFTLPLYISILSSVRLWPFFSGCNKLFYCDETLKHSFLEQFWELTTISVCWLPIVRGKLGFLIGIVQSLQRILRSPWAIFGSLRSCHFSNLIWSCFSRDNPMFEFNFKLVRKDDI